MSPSKEDLRSLSELGLSHLLPAPRQALLRARDLIGRYGWNAMSYQILNPGIRLWFSEDLEAVIGYVDAYGFRVVAGAPVCEPGGLPHIAAAFQREASAEGKKVCYFGAQEHIAAIMSGFGPVSKLLLGSQPVWDPSRWIARVSTKSSLRAQFARARNKRVTVSLWDQDRATGNADLEQCLLECATAG